MNSPWASLKSYLPPIAHLPAALRRCRGGAPPSGGPRLGPLDPPGAAEGGLPQDVVFGGVHHGQPGAPGAPDPARRQGGHVRPPDDREPLRQAAVPPGLLLPAPHPRASTRPDHDAPGPSGSPPAARASSSSPIPLGSSTPTTWTAFPHSTATPGSASSSPTPTQPLSSASLPRFCLLPFMGASVSITASPSSLRVN